LLPSYEEGLGEVDLNKFFPLPQPLSLKGEGGKTKTAIAE